MKCRTMNGGVAVSCFRFSLIILSVTLLCLILSGCGTSESSSQESDGAPADSSSATVPDTSAPPPPPLSTPSIGGSQNDTPTSMPDNQPAQRPVSSPEPTGALPGDRFLVKEFTFKFHKETKREICGDDDYTVYNGTMEAKGDIASSQPVDFTAGDFALSLVTPFDIYDIPSRMERENHDGIYTEETFRRKGAGEVFTLKDFRLEDDDLVYRNDDDMEGYFKNHGALMTAKFDFTKNRFEIKITRGDFSPYDVAKGEEMDFMISFPRRNTELEDFDMEQTWIYQGRAINSDDYYYDGDCP